MNDPPTTVLWRLRTPKREAAHAAILPGGPPFTLAFFVGGQLDRIENYETVELALFRAEDVKGTLLAEGWREE
ncbi:MAG TPA: hypothetical protein VL263_17800 [Vicinamibacterales bacterium]|jgi:hypothetical protein|nr:hypothetical protein [Vicinamibacterales bacterium]